MKSLSISPNALARTLFISALATATSVLSAAEAVPPSPTEAPTRLSTVVVIERSDSQIGVADSASQGNVGQAQLKLRPVIRPGEVLEAVPGLIVSQHSGEGKANQYYLRGFNLDHGTDFLTQIDGIPVNLVTHAHGQGWTDTGFLIPELVRTIRYQKGVYFAENGDLSTAGAADIEYFNALPSGIASLTAGSFDYTRGLLAASTKVGNGHLLTAVEAVYNNGPFQRGDHYRKGNVVLRYSQAQDGDGWSVTLMGYKAKWDATDQIPERAVASGRLDRFGAIDESDGGDSQRYSLAAQWQRVGAESITRIMVYGFYYDMSLFSNFTYFLSDPLRGDQFEQPDQRFVSGFKAKHTRFHSIGGASAETTLGLQLRNDRIRTGLHLTQARERHFTVREDEVRQTSISPYLENRIRWNDWFRSVAGVRLDGFRFDVESDRPQNSGQRDTGIVSPKGSLVFTPWKQTEIYLSGGVGFHSNDARGATTRVDPTTGFGTDADGNPIERAKPLVRTAGGELGVRTTWARGLQSTVTLWTLDVDSELVFSGDAGTTEASRPSRRSGVEIANYYSPTNWLTIDADVSVSKSRFREDAPGGNEIPGSVETVVAAGATVHDLRGWFAGLRLRYFGPRPLLEDNTVRSQKTMLVSANLGREFGDRWTAHLEIFNLFNRADSAIDYYYASRLPGEPTEGVADRHFHPIEPRSFRFSISRRF